jgi:phage-related protein
VQFKNSGYDANQMFNMLKNGADAGVWSVDKLGDAVKEMNIRFSDGTVADALAENAKALGLTSKEVQSLQTEYNKGGTSAQQAVGKMIDSILNVKDETKQYQLGVSVFGTMWEDLGAEAIKALMSTEGALDSTKATMEDIKNTKYDDLGSSLQQLGRMFKEQLLTPIAEHIVPKLQEFVNYAITNFPAILQTIKDVGNAFMEWLPTLATIGTAIGAYLVATKIIAFMEAIKNGTLALKLMSAAQAALNVVMSLNPIGLVVAAIAALVAAFVILWNKSDAFREFWIGLWDKIVSFTSTIVQKIRDFFVTLGTNISNAFSKVWDTIVKIFTPAVTWFSKLFTSVFNTLKSTIDVIIGLIKGIWTVITTVFSPLLAWVGTHITTPLTTAFTTVWNNLKTGATNAWTGIKTVFGTVATFFKDTFTKAWTAVKNVFSTGGKIFDGIKEGIVSMFKTIVNAIIRGINRVISVPFNAINAALNTIRNVGIADMKPFAGLPSISVPSIPELARGGILKRGQVGLLEGDGAEAVVPLEKNTQWLRAVAKQMAKELGVSGSGSVTGSVGLGGVVNNYNQTINSPKALTRLEIYRQSKNLLAFNGGVY